MSEIPGGYKPPEEEPQKELTEKLLEGRQLGAYLDVIKKTADIHFIRQEGEMVKDSELLEADLDALMTAVEVGLTSDQIKEAQQIGMEKGLQRKREYQEQIKQEHEIKS